MEYVDDLPHLARVRIPRWTGQSNENLSLEMHGFADASNRAYTAVVYLRVIHSISNFQVSLICAKTKVRCSSKNHQYTSSRIVLLCVKPTALLDKTRALLVERSDIRMDSFHNNISMVKITSLKMEHLCCYPSLRSSNFVIRHYMATCFFKRKMPIAPLMVLSASMLSSHDLRWNTYGGPP